MQDCFFLLPYREEKVPNPETGLPLLLPQWDCQPPKGSIHPLGIQVSLPASLLPLFPGSSLCNRGEPGVFPYEAKCPISVDGLMNSPVRIMGGVYKFSLPSKKISILLLFVHLWVMDVTSAIIKTEKTVYIISTLTYWNPLTADLSMASNEHFECTLSQMLVAISSCKWKTCHATYARLKDGVH
jgi:hypothetical protein